MITKMQPYVDRTFARMVAYKRLLTGTLSFVAGGVVTALAVSHGADHPTPLVPIALLVFFGGGAWAFRDGVRVLRELRRTA